MNNEQQKIIDRVRKMMALANNDGASEGERENALRMSYALLAKYNLTVDDLQEVEERVHEFLDSVHAAWSRQIANAIAKLFFCNYYVSHPNGKIRHNFVGKASNAVTASLISDYVMRSVRREAGRQAAAGGYSNAWKLGFCKGAMNNIIRRCKEMRAEQETTPVAGTSLAVIDLYKSEQAVNEAFIRKMLGRDLGTSKGVMKKATVGFVEGVTYANKINLNAQVGTNKNTLRIGKNG